MNYNEWIENLKQLTQNELQTAEEKAISLVLRKHGEEPKRNDFKRDTENPFRDPIVFFIILIFISAFVITGFEVFGFVGNQLEQNHVDIVYQGGFGIYNPAKVGFFQIGFLLMSEFMMIVTMIGWKTDVVTKEKSGYYNKYKGFWGFIVSTLDKITDIRFFVAMLSMSFIFMVNWQSGYNELMRVMIPIISVTLGYLIETYYSEWREENNFVTKQYNEALSDWKEFTKDPKKHNQYQVFFMNAIWERLKAKNSKMIDSDVPGNVKYLAVQRELENANWAKYGQLKERLAEQTNTTTEELDGKPAIQILRESMDVWSEGDNPIIRVENYSVDMNKLVFKNHSSGLIRESKSLGGLRKIVTTVVKGNGG